MDYFKAKRDRVRGVAAGLIGRGSSKPVEEPPSLQIHHPAAASAVKVRNGRQGRRPLVLLQRAAPHPAWKWATHV